MKVRNIVAELIKIAKDIISFDMTEREWEKYHKEHPNANKANHHIIKVPGKHFSQSKYKEYINRQRKAKIKYFKELKQNHPNYIPIVPKKTFDYLIQNKEYSCISAGINPNSQEDINNAKKDPDFIKNRTEQLRKDLDKLGVKYTEIVGNYDGEEPSFLISHNVDSKIAQKQKDNTLLVSGNNYQNNNKIIEKLNQLGKKYNQDSVAHSKNGKMEWHYTTGEKAGKRVRGLGTQMLNSADNYYSQARVGNNDFTMWSCDMSPAWQNPNALEDNPYFKQ